MTRPRVLTWHVHGAYLYYLSQAGCDFLLPVKEDGGHGYGGRAGSHPWGDNVIEIPAHEVRNERIDVVLCQSRDNWFRDRFDLLAEHQLELPHVYVEHDPPREHPTDTGHPVDDPDVLLVHVTHFNDLMWDSGRTPTTVIEHGVTVPDGVRYSGELQRGLVVVNQLALRGRRLGADLFDEARQEVPLDLVGIDAHRQPGGLGEVPHDELPAFSARYRFLFNPIRYTSLGLAVCEAMAVGLPVVGLATTEMATAVINGVNGFIDTDRLALRDRMNELLADRELAARLSAGARETAAERFGIDRFARDWESTLREVASSKTAPEKTKRSKTTSTLQVAS